MVSGPPALPAWGLTLHFYISTKTSRLITDADKLYKKIYFISDKNRANDFVFLFEYWWEYFTKEKKKVLLSHYMRKEILKCKIKRKLFIMKSNTCNREASAPTSSQTWPFHLPLIPTSFQAQSPLDSESLGSWQALFSWSLRPHCSEQNLFSQALLAKWLLNVCEWKHSRNIQTKIMSKNPQAEGLMSNWH